jgi:hypothetical protein
LPENLTRFDVAGRRAAPASSCSCKNRGVNIRRFNGNRLLVEAVCSAVFVAWRRYPVMIAPSGHALRECPYESFDAEVDNAKCEKDQIPGGVWDRRDGGSDIACVRDAYIRDTECDGKSNDREGDGPALHEVPHGAARAQ